MLDPLVSLSLAANVAELGLTLHDIAQAGAGLLDTRAIKTTSKLASVAKSTIDCCDVLKKQRLAELRQYADDLKAWGRARAAQIEAKREEEFQARLRETGSLRIATTKQVGDPKGVRDLDTRPPDADDKMIPEPRRPQEVISSDLVESLSRNASVLVAQMEGLLLEDIVVQHNTLKRKRDADSPPTKATLAPSEVQRLQSRFSELQHMLVLQLPAIKSQRSAEVLRFLQQIQAHGCALDTPAERMKILTQVEDSRHVLIKAFSGECVEKEEEARHAVDHILAVARAVDLVRRVLPSLAYEEFHLRHDRIPGAHRETFEWIFTDKGFMEWAIKNEEPLFWITGKPGSGKSTLLKFIAEHPQTENLLRRSAGSDELLIATHYFWNAGTPLQKTQIGLLRSLLLQLLESCPDLCPILLPHLSTRLRGDGAMSWSLKDLIEVFETLATAHDINVQICFIIDGLDEYVDEHSDLIALTTRLSSNPKVKLCLSSRPWNVFSEAFSRKRHITVEYFTRKDIRKYIDETLRADIRFEHLLAQDPEGGARLLEEISQKAHGVFLWVSLVGRSLIRGLRNLDTLEVLFDRIREMPDSLNAFFQRMFDRIEAVYKRHAARMLLAAYHAEHALPPFSLGCIASEVSDPNYAISLAVQQEGCHLDIDSVRTMLDARCADLLEADPSGISCLHRTVKDFLGQQDMYTSLQGHAGSDFSSGLSLARLALSDIKTKYACSPSLDEKLRRLMGCESVIESEHVLGYYNLLDDLDLNGNLILQSQRSSGGGLELYEFSSLAFQLRPQLHRLRRQCGITDETETKPDTPPEEHDFYTLFSSAHSSR